MSVDRRKIRLRTVGLALGVQVVFAVMCGGLTTVAGSVLVGYSLLGAKLAFVSLIALANLVVGAVGGLFGYADLSIGRAR